MWRLGGWIRETAWLLALVAVLLAAAAVAFFVLPPLVVSPEDLRQEVPAPAGARPAAAPTAVDLLRARNDVRTAGLALIAAVGAALATGFGVRTYYLSRRSQLGDRYAKAVEQLGSDEEARRVAAVAELEHLSEQAPAYRRRVLIVLAGFVRDAARPDDQNQPSGSVQEACTVLGRRRRRSERQLRLNLAGADLRGVRYDGADLRRVLLCDANLRGAYFIDADLRGADLTNAKAQSARFDGAKLAAILNGAQLQSATLDGADARGASLVDAALEGASMQDTKLDRPMESAR